MSGSGDASLQFLEKGAPAPFERARVAVLPVPYDATVSWVRGTARGPEAILRASDYLELYDEQMRLEPWRAGVWTDRMLTLPDDLTDGAEVVRCISARFGELLDAGKWVVMLGGEHGVTPGGVRAAAERHEELHLVQLDAHADLRESWSGTSWSHACAMSNCIELAPVHAIGIRSYSPEEARRMRQGIPGYRITHAWEMEGEGWIERALAGLAGRKVYLTIDVDYFDPAFLPSTGTPEPGGGQWWPTLRLLERLFEIATVVAADVVELCPQPGLHHADFSVARLVYKLIGYAHGEGDSAGFPETGG